MRRSLLAALSALTLLALPVQAQLFPSAPTGSAPIQPAATGEQVLMDATVWVNPPFEQSLCMALEAGQVTVSVRRLNDPIVQRPTEFHFYGFVADQDASLKLMVGSQETTGTTRVAGVDHYCWQINVNAPEADRLSNAERGAYVQKVAVKITFTP
jgi:hypothetical protein